MEEEVETYGAHLDGLRAVLELQQKGHHMIDQSYRPLMYANQPGCIRRTSVFEFMPQIKAARELLIFNRAIADNSQASR